MDFKLIEFIVWHFTAAFYIHVLRYYQEQEDKKEEEKESDKS